MTSKNKFLLFLLTVALNISTLSAQGGYGTYRFLDYAQSSRLTALGGANVSLADNDLNFTMQNPALLTEKLDKMLALSASSYLSDIIYGTAAYGMTLNEQNFFAFGAQYVDYGKFIETNAVNQELGDFTAKDMALSVSYARLLSERWTVGITAKPVFLAYERKTSFGIGFDAGTNYVSDNKLFSAGLVFRNIGSQLKGFHSDETGQYIEPLPFNILLGITQKLAHAPLRFSFTLHDLQAWNLNYQSTNQQVIRQNDSGEKKISFIDMAFRHTIIGIEFVPSNNFYVSAGYNHKRGREYSVENFKSLAGFSFGAGIKLSKFNVGFGMAQFQVGNYSCHFSISTSLEEFGL